MESKNLLKTQIVETLAYADLFDYPLKEEEVIRWLIGTKQESKRTYKLFLRRANGVVFRQDGFLHLTDRQRLIRLRRERLFITEKKYLVAQKISRILSHIPTILGIGISGSLAMANARKKDDIDLFIITKPGTLWLTRLFAVLVLELFGVRRRPNDRDVKDKICPNIFLDANFLAFPEKNLYTAHEICQLRMLFDRNNTYQKFMQANMWVRRYLPNAILEDNKMLGYEDDKKNSNSLNIFELLAKMAQLAYMKMHSRLKDADISQGRICFYPKTYNTSLLRKYQRRLKKYGV